MKKLTAPLVKFPPSCGRSIGGIAFGLVGVALPLTLFTGTDQLTTVIRDGAALGAGLLIAVVFAKILVFAVCEATGFIGGPFLVMLFIGGTAGVTAHVLIPGLPEGLAFAAMFAALPASLVAVPFSLLFLTALTTQIGTLQMAPVAVAVLTAYLAVSGSGLLMSLARKRGKPAAAHGARATLQLQRQPLVVPAGARTRVRPAVHPVGMMIAPIRGCLLSAEAREDERDAKALEGVRSQAPRPQAHVQSQLLAERPRPGGRGHVNGCRRYTA